MRGAANGAATSRTVIAVATLIIALDLVPFDDTFTGT
jgi:hypothetical protein